MSRSLTKKEGRIDVVLSARIAVGRAVLARTELEIGRRHHEAGVNGAQSRGRIGTKG